MVLEEVSLKAGFEVLRIYFKPALSFCLLPVVQDIKLSATGPVPWLHAPHRDDHKLTL